MKSNLTMTACLLAVVLISGCSSTPAAPSATPPKAEAPKASTPPTQASAPPTQAQEPPKTSAPPTQAQEPPKASAPPTQAQEPPKAAAPAPQPEAKAPVVTTAAAKAEPLFKDNCMACHGAQLQGGAGPNISKVGSTKSKDELIAQINGGGSNMPPFKEALKADEVEALAAWLAAKK